MKQWHALWIAALGFAIILAGFYIHPLEEPAVAAEEGSDRNEGTAGPAMDKNVDGTADEREDQADISDDTDANEHAGDTSTIRQWSRKSAETATSSSSR